MLSRRESRLRRHRRIRKKITGTPQRPRLCVFRSVKHIYAQVVDDSSGHTLASASSLDPDFRTLGAASKTVAGAREVGRLVGERARAQGVEAVSFDRGGFLYHGRVKSLADGAREAGLQF